MAKLANLALAFFLPLLAHSAEKPAAWDYWFTMTVNGKIHYGYYNERVEFKKDKVRFQNTLWKKEEGFINEEQLGTVAANAPDLAPLFFNFHSTYRATETSIDGNMDSKLLSVKIRRGDKDLPLVKRSEPSGVIFSQFFPVWLGLKLPSMKVGDTARFQAILEDSIDDGFGPVKGSARLEKPDELATKTKTQKLTVDFRGITSHWWVDRNGAAIRIEMPTQQVVVERAPEAQAKKFLTSD